MWWLLNVAGALHFGVEVTSTRDFCLKQMTVKGHRFTMHSSSQAGTYRFSAIQDNHLLLEEQSEQGVLDVTEYSRNSSIITFCWSTVPGLEPAVSVVAFIEHSEELSRTEFHPSTLSGIHGEMMLVGEKLGTMGEYFGEVNGKLQARRSQFSLLRLYWQVGTIGFFVILIVAKFLEARLTESFLREKKVI